MQPVLPSPGGDDPQLDHPNDDVQRLHRGFSLRSAFSLAFADVSPIVAMYAIFALGLFTAGPQFFWAFPIVLIGQLAVAAVFGELSSRWPFAGSVYQWARHVRGTTSGWAAAWAYMWGLTIALATLAYAAAGFLLEVFGVAEAGRWTTALLAIAIIVIGTATNMIGRQILKVMVIASITCEIVGSVGLGAVLLLFYRENPFSTLLDGLPGTSGWAAGPMLLAVAYTGWAFVGFEAAGSIAEEVENPSRNVPKAIIGSLVGVALIVMFSSAALILAIPNLDQVLAGQSGDPVADTLTAHLGAGIAKPLLIMFVIGFISSFLAVQAAVSRCIWGTARDRGLPASTLFSKLAGPERMPINAIGLTAVVAAALVLLAGSDFYNILINFTVIGFYIAFGIPVLGAAWSRITGRWTPGEFSLGRWGAPVTYFAAVWIIAETVNVAWPRVQPGQPWYINWSMVITTVVLGIIGGAIYLNLRRKISEPLADRLQYQSGPGL
ncbi:amino acid permease [Mycolicibacterium sp. CH28]|uniref:APC family permease n=1 Tax=Mycolicibacterium sp. CH28 TaxID=2512237 RepID=UPI0010813D87|nr:amino acid permease [Mycolicibacterium sp. CH28]TGD84548.1 amino acid permease [Mycolicibacterium sp. CH28]